MIYPKHTICCKIPDLAIKVLNCSNNEGSTTRTTVGKDFPDALISSESEASIEGLTKKGGIKEGRTGMWMGFGMAVAFPIFGVLYLLNTDADYSHAAEDLRVFLGPLADLLVPILVPLMPVFPYLFFALGAVSAIGAIVSMYSMSRAKSAPETQVGCPACDQEYEFSAANRSAYKFVCKNCYARIVGTKDGYTTKHHCDYCEHEYYGGAQPAKTCMSCGYKPGVKEQQCSHCSELIPKNVRYCRSCSNWVAPPHSFGVSLLGDQVSYKPTEFSVRTCLAYINELAPRIKHSSDAFDDIFSEIKDFNKDIQMYGSGGLHNAISPFTAMVHACLEAIQWTYHHGGELEKEVIAGLNESLAKSTPLIEKLLDSRTLLKSDRKMFTELITSTQSTISAALEHASTKQ